MGAREAAHPADRQACPRPRAQEGMGCRAKGPEASGRQD
jgi:hypothetical protein